MAVHFDFVVEDVDAENICMVIRDTALRNDELIIEYMTRADLTEAQRNSHIEWLRANKAYMLGLIEQMKNTRV